MSSILSVQQYRRPNSVVINPHSFEAAYGGGVPDSVANFASAAWPTATLAILYPFRVLTTYQMGCMWVLNGGTVSGNFDIGVYDNPDGGSVLNRVASIGSTAQSGANVPQAVANSGYLPPGNYYAALCFDNTTATTISRALAQAGMVGAHGGGSCANGAVTLGATLTIAAANAYVPFFGISQAASV